MQLSGALERAAARYAVAPLLRDAISYSPITVSITGGAGEHQNEYRFDDWRVAKPALIGGLQVVFDTGRLKIPKEPEHADLLERELINVEIQPPPVSDTDPEAWRENESGDLVFAVALACWRAKKHLPTPQPANDAWSRKMERAIKEGQFAPA